MTDRLLRVGESYFLSPVCLVPNGRAHLGHISGPLLRMDVARRHLLRAGAVALAINTSDSHESHVAVQAYREDDAPHTLARHYHKRIRDDLRALDIEWDDFIDPLEDEWNERYEAMARGLVRRIVLEGNSVARAVEVAHLRADAEPSAFAFRPQPGEPVLSGWIKGTCPACGDELTGFFCERCGGYFEPAEMLNAATAHFEGAIEPRSRTSLFLRPPLTASETIEELAHSAVTPSFRSIVAEHLARAGTAIRLTVPSPWGIPWVDPKVPAGEVIWSYSALLIGCHLTAGERFAQLTGGGNPFLRGSGVTCVISFGVDNTIPYLLGAQGCLYSQDTYKPVDFFLTNHFALLDGAKFSTSRRHVVWGGDLVDRAGANPALARLLLCLSNPEFARVDFDTRRFQADYARLAYRLSSTLANALRLGEGTSCELDPAVGHSIEAELVCQSAHLDFRSFDLAAAAASVIAWLDAAERLQCDARSALTWMLGFALLAEPFMPSIAQSVWRDLGQRGVPRLAGRESRRLTAAGHTCLAELDPLDPRRFEDCMRPEGALA